MRFQLIRDIVLIERYDIHRMRLHIAPTRTTPGCTTVVADISATAPIELPYVGLARAYDTTPIVCFDEADHGAASLFRAYAPPASTSLPRNTVAQRGLRPYNGTPWDEIGRCALVATDVYLQLALSAAIPVTQLDGTPLSRRAITGRRPIQVDRALRLPYQAAEFLC
ncbi:hypothetical protein [Nonomuraea jabiensis]|uniref:hypothetical protein n=1 Tax=Nonomuraea jabiensis TaxID=882448 RepID=UPI003D729344